jgi:hypothetical protein
VFCLDLAGLTLFHNGLLDTFTGHVYGTFVSNVSWMRCHQVGTY